MHMNILSTQGKERSIWATAERKAFKELLQCRWALDVGRI